MKISVTLYVHLQQRPITAPITAQKEIRDDIKKYSHNLEKVTT